jgi:hypothetical protein
MTTPGAVRTKVWKLANKERSKEYMKEYMRKRRERERTTKPEPVKKDG